MRGILAVTYTTLVDMLTGAMGNGLAAMQKVDELITAPPWPTEEEWLEGSEAEEGQAAMMEKMIELFGDSAPARPREDLEEVELLPSSDQLRSGSPPTPPDSDLI